MRRILRFFKKVPIWVWLFVAASQVLTLCIIPRQVSQLNDSIQRFGANPLYADLKSRFEDIRRGKQNKLFAAAILCPVSIGLAFWKWSSRDAHAPAADVSSTDLVVEASPKPGKGGHH